MDRGLIGVAGQIVTVTVPGSVHSNVSACVPIHHQKVMEISVKETLSSSELVK